MGVKLYTPKAVELASQTRDPDTGIAIRLVKAWDARTSTEVTRWDCSTSGLAVSYSDNCCVRILGA